MVTLDETFLLPTAPDYAVQWEALDARFEWIQAMRNVPQDPIWHAEGDVWIHTSMVCRALAQMPAWRALDERQRRICWLAALLHDVAKPYSTQHEDGRIRSRHHSPRGAVHARRLLWSAGLPPRDREQVCGLIRHHQLPIHALSSDDGERRTSAASMRCSLSLLRIVAEADIRGRVSPSQADNLESIALFGQYCSDLECAEQPRAFASEHTRLVYFRDGRPASVEAFDDTTCTVTLMCGLPGAGKTHWIAEHRPQHAVVSLDALRRTLGVDPTDGNQGAVRHAALDSARVLLRAGTPFVWDATNLQRSRRKKLLQLFFDYGARVEIVIVDTPAQTLRRQNAARAERVPDAVIDGMLQRWEAPDETEAQRVIRVGWA